MNEAAVAFWVAFALVLAVAAAQDVRTLRIPNIISVAVLLIALGHALLVPAPAPFWHHLLSFLIVFAGGLVLFSIGWLGGGDVKLFAAAAAWFGLADLAWFVAAVLMTGALLTLVMIGGRLIVSAGASWRSMRSNRSIPYGVAIATAAILLSARSLG
jgi:prepilin peptidase CpaA